MPFLPEKKRGCQEALLSPGADRGLPPAKKGGRSKRRWPEFGPLGPPMKGLAVGAGSGRQAASSSRIIWAEVAARGATGCPRG